MTQINMNSELGGQQKQIPKSKTPCNIPPPKAVTPVKLEYNHTEYSQM